MYPNFFQQNENYLKNYYFCRVFFVLNSKTSGEESTRAFKLPKLKDEVMNRILPTIKIEVK